MARRVGWFLDRSGRHQWRYRDGQWTTWVADEGQVSIDATGLDAIRRSRRRGRIIAGVVVAILAIPFVLFMVMVSLDEQRGRDHAAGWVREMDSWTLPPTVQRSKRPDEVYPPNFGASTESATRYYLPAQGATTDQAAADLVTALQTQGYSDLDPWDGSMSVGSCPGDPNCYIGVSTSGRFIEVDFS